MDTGRRAMSDAKVPSILPETRRCLIQPPDRSLETRLSHNHEVCASKADQFAGVMVHKSEI